ncbi:hypothetical protein CY0110_31635 [Crocosphaera chwakensis CCY0110]|uniref:Uncharacterized protein n=1 Tax=Crocosphaera chwakensis CCY0110 TaxID=391612 RepID=A3IWG3_9CHRO|nr:hypothetical protein CY0110_31635 [Crocosphaera chwakensis CCY0110]
MTKQSKDKASAKQSKQEPQDTITQVLKEKLEKKLSASG